MKNQQNWQPSKFAFNQLLNKWLPNKLYPGISVHSYIIALNQIKYYQTFIEKYCLGYLLDCGCGDVPYYGIYKDIISDVYCVDRENPLLQRIHIDQFVDLSKPIQLESAQFDSVLLSDVLEHIAEPELLLKELNRLLKPGGKIVIMVPFLYRLHEEPHDYFRYTEYALKYLLEKSRFTLIEFQSYGGIVDTIFDLLNKGFFNTPYRSKIINWLYKWCMKIHYFKRINESRRYSFPLGYCVAAGKIK